MYLDGLARVYRRPSIVVVEVIGERGAPVTVAREACQRRKEEAAEQRRQAKRCGGGRSTQSPITAFEVWAVFDRDEHPHFAGAINQCEQAGVGIAWSNPCVELWALLHCREQTAYIKRHDCQRALRGAMPGYDHDCGAAFELEQMTEDRRIVARSRAWDLHRRAVDAGRPTNNPSTAFWKLVDAIVLGSSKEARAAVSNEPRAVWWSLTDPGR